MKHENLFKIYIPEPCHEDWNKMTPNQQGAFCKVCAKTVVDFSNRTDVEIQRFLLENIDNKVCGRFRINQLDDNKEEIPRLKIEKPKFEFPGYLLPVMTPFRAYALAVMLFASVALQSCGNSNEAGGEDIKLAGAVVLVDSTQTDTTQLNSNDKINLNDKIQGGVTIDNKNDGRNINTNQGTDSICVINNDDLQIVGRLKVVNQTDTLKTDTTETMIKGEIEPVKMHGIMMKKENKQ